jgi:hypothetical protein
MNIYWDFCAARASWKTLWQTFAGTESYASRCGFPESDHFFIYTLTASVGWRAI